MIAEHKTQWCSHLDRLKAMHADIAKLCEGKKVAYVDLPFHYNVGDLLIYLGTEQFLADYNVDVRYRAFSKHINHKRLAECEVILFHGGGNFGDIYIKHQEFRESVIKRYPNKRIVMLPATIHYKSDAAHAKSKAIHSQHQDLHIFLRDVKSEKIAEGFSDNITLMPDMAHSLHPIVEACEVEDLALDKCKILNMRRIDVEAKSVGDVGIKKRSFDWDSIVSSWDQILYHLATRAEMFSRFKGGDALVKLWKRQANTLVFRSVFYFNSFNLVYTDRMHGLILSYLLGKNVKLIDNSYGKNYSYYELWLKESELIEQVGNEAK
ncbi:polysaccharide pyruvyl transferase family protein [Agaribacterium haliotis]|uniref:polysaccharide pyruvyl transferase family protein n=1 Tax=Agaribacterium haliotis TaxID=2013869 RepID=UPI000BB57CFB|nr:polysaccharide pyruvyl transferase family protein [Agaribacterium haliotis]